jgi:alpha-glucosidase
VQAQSGDPGSTLELYRSALTFRRAELLGFDLEWLDGPPGSLAFRRRTTSGGVVACVANTGPEPVPLPGHTEVVLASGPLDDGTVPPDTAAWLRLR